jgi:thioredoxin-like negative regulator of GroEL
MKVHRLSEKNLIQIVTGKTLKPALCVIKFYSNGCSYCHNLKEHYQHIADSFSDDPSMYFFAFNIDDVPKLPKQVSINGVPTICKINTGVSRPAIQTLKDPPDPDGLTWYHPADVLKFIKGSTK